MVTARNSANSVIHLIVKDRPVSGGQETFVLIALKSEPLAGAPVA